MGRKQSDSEPDFGLRPVAAGRSAAAAEEGSLAEAVRLHRGGELGPAEAMYRQALEAEPEHAEALHLLGVVTHQRGDSAAAVDLIAKAIARDPDHAKAHANLGVALAHLGKLEAAVAAYRTAVGLDPDHAAAHFNLGVALARLGDLDDAVAAYRAALAVKPGYAEAHSNLGAALKDQDKLDEAVASCRQAVACDSELAGASYNLGLALKDQGELDQAISAYREAIALEPDYAEAHVGLGVALRQNGDLDGAIAAYRMAIALKPCEAGVHTNLGCAFRELARLDEAVACHQRAIGLQPKLAVAYRNLGIAHRDQGKFDESLANFDQALAIDPGSDEARFGEAMVHLLQGNFAAGWLGYLARTSMSRNDAGFYREPLELGLSGKRVLLVRNQGLGDELFFLRFGLQLKARGVSIVYRADPKIASMVERLPFIDQLAGPEDGPETSDLVLSVGDLPYLLGMTDAGDIPPSIELSVLPERLAEMRARLAGLGPPPYIGVTWRAGIAGPDTLSKIAPLERLTAVLRPIGGTIVVLQRKPVVGEIEALAGALDRSVHDFTALNNDLEGMLALVDLLDDYVCVSNTNFHLRAARGRVARVLVPNPPEFRWMVTGEESPWFPGSRVYRQTAAGSWDVAFKALAGDLASRWPDG